MGGCDRRVWSGDRAGRVWQPRRLALGVLVVGALTGIAGCGEGGGAAPSTPAQAPVTAGAATTAAAGSVPSVPKPRVHRRPKPRLSKEVAAATAAAGALPQTQTVPSARSRAFRRRMAALWEGVVSGSVKPAVGVFFPERAYMQLKAIAGAQSDWENRLLRDFALDIGAAHALLGGGAHRARLVAVHVESSYAHWVPPGVCANSIGYYEMPGARLVYREDGRVRSFAIASMISWRGEWYVVHMGAVLRASEGGVVDEPESGAGTPAYSGTC